MLSILSFIFGASIGSFVQVIASRLHVAPIMKGRSKCLSCGEALRASDLIPVISYLWLRGKCRHCKSVYGVSALVVEVLFGVTFVVLYQLIIKDQVSLLVSLLWLVYYTLLFGTRGVMALYDRAHSYIPSMFLYGYLALTAIMYCMRIANDPHVLTMISPVFVAVPFLLVWLITRGRGLGFGDVILFFGVGMFFDSLQGLAVLMVSVWLGAIVGIYIKYISRQRLSDTTAIPFVPFIVIGFLIVLFTDMDIFSIAMSFS